MDAVPPRTIRRDLEVLRAVGVPVHQVRRAREVRYAILDDGPPLRLDGDVALALHMALELLRPFEGTPVGESLEHVVRQLSRSVPAAARAHFDAIVRALVVRPMSAPSYSGSSGVLATIQEALARRVELRLEYESADSPRKLRIVEPRALVHAGRGLYLVAHDAAPRIRSTRNVRGPPARVSRVLAFGEEAEVVPAPQVTPQVPRKSRRK